MANLKEIRNRITSIGSTMQITKAMKMVSAAKLKKAQDAITAMRPYSNKLTELLQSLSATLEGDVDSIYAQDRAINKVLLVVVTSNRGLCGGFNTNIVRTAREEIVADLSRLSRLSQNQTRDHQAEVESEDAFSALIMMPSRTL